jgi:hypothetical protein
MSPERWERIKGIYDAAVDLAPGCRELFLREARARDEDPAKEVASLLAQRELYRDPPSVGRPKRRLSAKRLADHNRVLSIVRAILRSNSRPDVAAIRPPEGTSLQVSGTAGLFGPLLVNRAALEKGGDR